MSAVIPSPVSIETPRVESEDLPVQIITPHNGLDAFRDAFRSIGRDWRQSTSLAWRMFVRDTRAAYRQSFLGYVWLLLPALANTLVWVFLNGQNVVNIESGDVPYPLFVFVGTALWTAFSGGLTGAMGVIQEAQGTLAKVNFPHESLLMTAFCKSMLTTLVTAVFVIPFLLLFPVALSWTAVLFPVGLVCITLFGLSLGLIIVPIGALFSDLTRAIHLGLRFAFFLTPVVFPIPPQGWGRILFQLNPVTPLLVTTRSWLVGGEATMLPGFMIVMGVSALLLLVGIITFKVAMPHIIERISG